MADNQFKNVIVLLPNAANYFGFPAIHISRPLSFVTELLKIRLNLAGGHVHLGYQRLTHTNETEVVFLPDTTTLAEAVQLIIQVNKT